MLKRTFIVLFSLSLSQVYGFELPLDLKKEAERKIIPNLILDTKSEKSTEREKSSFYIQDYKSFFQDHTKETIKNLDSLDDINLQLSIASRKQNEVFFPIFEKCREGDAFVQKCFIQTLVEDKTYLDKLEEISKLSKPNEGGETLLDREQAESTLALIAQSLYQQIEVTFEKDKPLYALYNIHSLEDARQFELFVFQLLRERKNYLFKNHEKITFNQLLYIDNNDSRLTPMIIDRFFALYAAHTL